MVDIEITDIKQQRGEGDEVEHYIVEYSIPDYPNTYRTDPIPAEEFDDEVAKDRVETEASPLISSTEIQVKLPNETTDENSASSRRDLLEYGALIVGVGGLIGVGGALTGVFGGGNRTAAVPDNTSTEEYGPTDNPTESPTQSPTQTDPSENTPTATSQPESQSIVIDDFNSGNLPSEWVTVDGSGRGAFEVQSDTVPEGEYALKGVGGDSRSSGIERGDFRISRDRVSIQFFLKLGPVLTGYERANKFRLLGETPDSDDVREEVVMFDQKDRSKDPNEDYTPPEGQVTTSELESLSRVEVNGIDFSSNTIAEIRINGEVLVEDIDFIENHSEISRIRIDDGNFGNQSRIVVDDISFSANS